MASYYDKWQRKVRARVSEVESTDDAASSAKGSGQEVGIDGAASSAKAGTGKRLLTSGHEAAQPQTFHISSDSDAESEEVSVAWLNALRSDDLEEALRQLEPVKEEHFGLYCASALKLAYAYMHACASARLSVALNYLERVLRLLGGLDESSLRAGLLLQAQVAYAECIIKLIREAAVPTYSAWFAGMQSAQEAQDSWTGHAQQQLDEMKQLSAAFLLWHIFWLCRANRAMSFVPIEKREVERWTIDRDLCELMGDTLYDLSRYPADDDSVDALLAGKMETAEGICAMVEEGLHTWALQGQTETGPGESKLSSDAQPHGQLGAAGAHPDPPDSSAFLQLSFSSVANRIRDLQAIVESAAKPIVAPDSTPAEGNCATEISFTVHPTAPADIVTDSAGSMLFHGALQSAWQPLAIMRPPGTPLTAPVETWYLDHVRIPQCYRSRVVWLGSDSDPHTWVDSMIQAWDDVLLPEVALHFHVVQPSPTEMPPFIVAHVIMVQQPFDGFRSVLVSVHDSQNPGRLRSQHATLCPYLLLYSTLLGMANVDRDCQHPRVDCAAWVAEQPLLINHPLPIII